WRGPPGHTYPGRSFVWLYLRQKVRRIQEQFWEEGGRLLEGQKEKSFTTEATEGPQRERRVREGIFRVKEEKRNRRAKSFRGSPRSSGQAGQALRISGF